MFEKIKNIFFILLSFLLSVEAIYLIFGETISNIVVSSETMFMPFFCYFPLPSDTDYFWRTFLSSDHSWFLVSFITHLFSRILPVYTNNHPQDFYLEAGWVAYFSIFCGFCYVMSLNAAKYFSRKSFAVFAFWAIYPFIVNAIQSSDFFWVLTNDTWFICYIINPIFPLLLIQIVEKYYVTSEWIFSLPQKNTIIPHKVKHGLKIAGVILLMFFTGIGHELFRFIFLGSLILTFILHKCFLKEKIIEKQFWAFLFVALLMNCFIFILPNFQDWFGQNVDEIPSLTIFGQAFSAFWEYVILENIWQIIFLSIFSGILYFVATNKDKSKRILIWIFSVIFSLLLFNFIIIMLTDCDLAISQHDGITFLTKTVFLYAFFSIIGYLVKFTEKKYNKIIISLVTLFLFSWFLIFSYQRNFYVFDEIEAAAFSRENQYIVEKFYAIYGKKHNVIYAFYPKQEICKYSIKYLKYWYGGNPTNYKIKFVCSSSDNKEDCRKKMLKLIFKKSKYKFTEEELDETDFSDIKAYQKQKKKGKIFVDFF